MKSSPVPPGYVRALYSFLLPLILATACNAPGDQARTEPVVAESSRAALTITDLPSQGLTLDPNGYTQNVCIDNECATGQPKLFNFAPGTYNLHTHYSYGIDPTLGLSFGTLTVDAAGRATLVSDHFDRVDASTIRLKTAPIHVDLAGYGGVIGFDWSGGGVVTQNSTVHLPTGRRFLLMDFASKHLTAGFYVLNPSYDMHVNHDGTVTMGAEISAYFTFDPATRILRARTVPVTIDFKGYGGTLGFGDRSFGQGPFVTLQMLRDRKYGFLDFSSLDPTTNSYGFTNTGQATIENDELIFNETLKRFFNVNSQERRVEPIVGVVTAHADGYFNIPGHIAGWGNGPPQSRAMILGRKYGVLDGGPGSWTFELTTSGVCTPSTGPLQNGATLRLECRPAPLPAAAPLDVTATVISSSRIDLRWRVPSLDHTGVRVERMPGSGGTWTAVAGCTLGPLFEACSDTTDLQLGATYQYRVVATSIGGDAPSVPVTVSLAPPATITQLTATVSSANTIDLEWRQGDASATGTVVMRKASGGEFETIALLSGTAQAYRDTVPGFGQYSYQVVAEKGDLPPSSSDIVVVAFLPLTPPLMVNAAPMALNRIDVTWTVADAEATGFRIARSEDGVNFQPLFETTAAFRSYSDMSVAPNVTYYYSVVSLTQFDESAPTTSGAVTIAPTTTPQGFIGVVTAAGQIALSWEDVANEAGYWLQYSENGGGWVSLSLPANTTVYVHNGLNQASSYAYRLLALSPVISTPPAELPYALKPGLPTAPTDVRAYALSAGTLEVVWTDVTNETDYQIRRTQSGNTTTFTRPSNTTAIQLPGLNTSNYTIDVIARNGAGTARTTVTSRATAPAAPSGLTAVAQAGLKVRLSWTDNSNNERFFEVYRSLQSGGPWTQAVVLSNAATWTDSALLPSRRYYYRVRAVNGIGASSYVNANTTTLNPCQGLGAGAACDDGSACTTGDVCNSSGVCAGVAKSCDDGNDCTVDSCSFATGICGSTPKEAGTSCDDNDVCSATSTCNGTGACLAATAVVCPEDGNPCTEEVCLSSPRGCEARFKDACDYGTCTPTGGTPAFECPAVASIEINASAMTDPVVVRAHDPPGFIVQIDPRTSRTLTLTANGATYMVENTTDGVLGNFRLSADGKIQTTDTAHFKGNGTTELVILDPDRPIANMVWEMEERLGKDDVFNLFPIVTRDPARPDVGVNPTKWNVYLDACSSVPGRTPNSSYKWVISPGLNGQQTSVDATTNCRQRFQFPALGQYAVGIEVTSQDGHKGITAQTITLKDYVVVSFGDSYASGEGNPTLPAEHVKMSGQFGPRWDDSGAHYSRWSGPTQAALLLERSDPHSSVTYLPFAASGGVITNLFSVDKENYHAWPQVFVVQPWGTVLADPGNRPPQIDLARAALCNGDPNPATFRAGTDCSQARPIDYVLLSIGGNDIGFSDTITACAVPVTINVAGEDVAHKNCSVSASGRYYGAPDWRPDGPYVSKSVERLDRLANLAIDQNPIGYGRLDQELRTRLPIGNGTKIFITEYPDALTATTDGELCPEIRLHDAAGILQSVQAVLLTGLSAIAIGPWAIGAAYVSFAITSGVCNGDPRGPDFCADGVILASELRWARDNVANRLNQIVHSTAQLGWTPVTGIAEEYAGRAYCNPMGFMVTYWESFSTQEDMFGSLHPNRGGQDVIARHLAKAMKVGDKEPALIARPTFAGTSEERPPAMCPEQSAIAGVACHGDYCDDVEIMCKSPRKDVVIETDRPISRSFFSSHQNPGVFDFCDRGVCTPHIGVNCGISGVAVGLECNGSDCTEVALHCSHLSKGRLQKCGWTETVSDESKWNVFHAGKVANGLRCFGENCDSMSFFVCDMVAE